MKNIITIIKFTCLMISCIVMFYFGIKAFHTEYQRYNPNISDDAPILKVFRLGE